MNRGEKAELSSYEDYTRKSGNYDKTREPVGTEIFLGCFAHAPVPLNRTVVLDAGCGTGNYSDALLHYVGRIEAVDMNAGMLEVATRNDAPRTHIGQVTVVFASRRYTNAEPSYVCAHLTWSLQSLDCISGVG
jgi:predicted RNA methylase